MNNSQSHSARSCFSLLLTISVCLSGCTDRREKNLQSTPVGLTKVTLALNWFPEIEHGGFYAAKLNGHYEAAGLDVEILPGGPDAPVIERVGSERVTFGVSNADRVLLGRAGGADVVAVMAALQNSPRCIIVHEDSGIDSFEKLNNVTLAMSEKAAFSHFLRKRFPLENVRIVPYGGSVAQFLINDNFAQQGYVFSEPIIARKENAKPNVLMVSDAGFNPYSSLIITHGSMIDEKPDLVRKFAQASITGWRDYLDSPEKTNDHIHSLNPEIDRDVLESGMPELKKLCFNSDSQLEFTGEMKAERWETLVSQLIETGLIEKNQVEATSAYSLKFFTATE